MISIIVCTYNRANYLYDALESIASNDFPRNEYEIILVNNNSTDDSEEKCQQFVTKFPDVNLRYCTESKQGLSFARNKGIAESNGDILVFLDDDVVVKSDYLKNIKSNLDNIPDLMAFGGKITPRFEAGHPPKWLNRWMYSLISATNSPDKAQKYGKRKYPIGANMGFRRQCLEKSGYFNTELGRTGNILLGGEEKDIFLKIKALGMEIYYFPDVEIEHIIPESRTTEGYIERVGLGVGISERIRCTSLGKQSLRKRHFQEFVKWCGTIVLATYYTLTFRLQVAKVMWKFRKNVTKGLKNPDKSNLLNQY